MAKAKGSGQKQDWRGKVKASCGSQPEANLAGLPRLAVGVEMAFVDQVFGVFYLFFGGGARDAHINSANTAPKPPPRRVPPPPPPKKPNPIDNPDPGPAAADPASGNLTDVEKAEAIHFLDSLVIRNPPQLTDADYQRCAERLGCAPSVIRAVAMVESGGRTSWDDAGRPKVLFEPHRFSIQTNGKYEKDRIDGRPDLVISDKNWRSKIKSGKAVYPGFDDRWQVIRAAYERDKDAALMSVSWGKFQVMGSHYANLKYTSVHDFVKKMATSEAGSLEVFEAYVRWCKLEPALRAAPPKWETIALLYNGKGNVATYSDLMKKKHAQISGKEGQKRRSEGSV